MANAEVRARYPDVMNKDWAALGFVRLQTRLLDDPGLTEEVHDLLPARLPENFGLTGEIHDLFQFNIPGRRMRIWQDQTFEQYWAIRGSLEPVFRLATNFLLCPASLDWFYYLIYAPREPTDPVILHNGDAVHEYRRDDTPMETRHQKARAALQRLAMTHTISLDDFKDEYNDEGRTVPSMRYHEKGVNIKDDDPEEISGIRPHIGISQDFVRYLMNTYMEGSQSRPRMLNMWIKMAVTWGHEIAHAAWMASNRRLLRNCQIETSQRVHATANKFHRDQKEANINEDLFEDEKVAEPGYSWENFVFGGTIELHDFKASNPLVFIKWPNFLKGAQGLRRGAWKPSATEYFIPMQYSLSINSQQWWDNVDPEDPTALYIKKIVGIRVYHTLDIDDDWSSSQSSEGIWPTDEERSPDQSQSHRVSRIIPDTII